jgi:ABC-type glycerol-3-phosphate transport system substrate-binding protein
MTIQKEKPKLLTVFACFLAFIFFSVVNAQTPNPDLEATLEIWGWDGAFTGLKAVDEKFLELYPNITLNYVPRPTPDTNQQILLSATAGSVISVLPLIIIFLFLQRYLIEGLTAGSVKG